MSSVTGGGSKSSSGSNTQTDVRIPGFLEPFIRQSTGIANQTLLELANVIGLGGYGGGGGAYGGDPIRLNDVAGPGDVPIFVDPGQNAFVDAQGNVIAPFQEGVVPGLRNDDNNVVEVRGNQVVGVGTNGVNELFTMPFIAGGGGGALGGTADASQLVAPFSDAQIAAQNAAIERSAPGGLFANAQDAIGTLASQGVDVSALEGLPQQGIPSLTTDTLSATARGDYLFGGDAFNAAVDAAVRQATPGILSTFGGSGAGGASGGLAQEALGTAAIDAFARQYAQERANQVGAAGTLGTLGLADAQYGLNAANSLTDARSNSASTQMEAAQLLPAIGTADLELLNSIGEMQQTQAQNELDAPRNALLQLLAAALGGTPISSLLGSDQRTNGSERSLYLGGEYVVGD